MPLQPSPETARQEKKETAPQRSPESAGYQPERERPNVKAYGELMNRARSNFEDPQLRPLPTKEKPGTTNLQKGMETLLTTYISPYLMQDLIRDASREARQIQVGDLFRQLTQGASIHNLELTLGQVMAASNGSVTIADTVARHVYYVDNLPSDADHRFQRQDIMAVEKLLTLQIPPDLLGQALTKANRLGNILHEIQSANGEFASAVREAMGTLGEPGQEIQAILLPVLEKGLVPKKLNIPKTPFWKRLAESVRHTMFMKRAGITFKEQRNMGKRIQQYFDAPMFNAPTITSSPQANKYAIEAFYRNYPDRTKIPQKGILPLTPEQEEYLRKLPAKEGFNPDGFRKYVGEMNYNWVVAQEIFGGRTYKSQEGEYF